MTGSVVQVSVSSGGVPKRAVAAGELTARGVVGDAWRDPFHGGPKKAILLVTAEGLDELMAQGYAVFPGALGENLTTRGIDRRAVRLGQHWRVGAATIAVTQPRLPCATLDVWGAAIQAAIYDARVQRGDATSPRWGLSGFYASVIEPGIVRTGDPIAPPG